MQFQHGTIRTVHIFNTPGVRLKNSFNEDLNRANNWATENDLRQNSSKSTSLIISRSGMAGNSWRQVNINGTEIPYTDKNLGIWFDERLNWNNYILTLCGKLNGSVCQLRKIAWTLPCVTRLRLVKSLVVPLFSYTLFTMHLQVINRNTEKFV